MVLLKEARAQLIEYGKKLLDTGLTVGTGGNISVFDQETGYMAITPSGVDYYKLQEEDIVIMDLEENVIEGHLKPSSEYHMHALVYKNRPEAGAMIHTHALYATTISCLRENLLAIDYLVAHAGGKDIRCAEYAPYGTLELAEKAIVAMEGRKAVLLANHGLNVLGGTIEEAFAITEQIEFCSRLYWQAKAIGSPVILSDNEMETMVERFVTYGQQEA